MVSEIDLTKRNRRMFKDDINKKVLDSHLIRKERKLEWLTADYKYHHYRDKLFRTQSKKCLNNEIKI